MIGCALSVISATGMIVVSCVGYNVYIRPLTNEMNFD
jgi:preprotein translocase subunit Sss1